jgi:hypothetical protein
MGVSKQGVLNLLRPLIKPGLMKCIGTKQSGRYISPEGKNKAARICDRAAIIKHDDAQRARLRR